MELVIPYLGILTVWITCSIASSAARSQHGSSRFCIPPPPPDNGSVSLGAGYFIVKYACNPGFELVGTAVVVCVAGKWSSVKPKCISDQDYHSSLVDSKKTKQGFPLDVEFHDQQVVTALLPPKPGHKTKNGSSKRRRKERRKNAKKGGRRNGRKKDKSMRRRRRKKNSRDMASHKKMAIDSRNLLKSKTTEDTDNNLALEMKTKETTKQKREEIQGKKKKKRRRKRRKKGKRGKKRRRKKTKSMQPKASTEFPPKHGHIGTEISNEVVPQTDLITDKLNVFPNMSKIAGNVPVVNLNKGGNEIHSKQHQIETNSIFPTGNDPISKQISKNVDLAESLKTPFYDTAETFEKSENSVFPHHQNPNRDSGSIRTSETSIIASKDDLLQDIINKIHDPKEMDKTNLFDMILRRRLEKERKKKNKKKITPPEPHDDSAGTPDPPVSHTPEMEHPSEPSNHSYKEEILEISDVEQSNSVEQQSHADIYDRDDDYEGSSSDYEENYEALPDGYPDTYNGDISGAGEKGQDSSALYGSRGHDLSEDTLHLDRKHSQGFPSQNERFYDESDATSLKERFVHEENIVFSELDSSCVISELDSIYLPPPTVSHGHVTDYMLVTNPAPPNNVYVEAIYECGFGFKLSDDTSNRLFCRKNKWIGILPLCVSYEDQEGQCGPDNGGCEQICANNDDKFSCSCYRGFTLNQQDGVSCQDIDECLVNNGGCEAVCFNKLGSHQCYCPKGYRLATNGKTCVDKNECILRNGHGPCQDTCHNTEGGYICSCDGIPGSKLSSDNHTCEDVDECALNNGGCSHICLNTFGQTFCDCPEGYILGMDWKTCNDINECDYDGVCDKNCKNTPGSYQCLDYDIMEQIPELKCDVGFALNEDLNLCEDVNECADGEFGCTHTCINTNGSAYCICPSGYQLSDDARTCSDVDECMGQDNPCSHMCINTEGSFLCGCPGGLSLSPDQLSCVDTNECASDNGGCEHLCTNHFGSFGCGCKEGYLLASDGTSCQDIDECQEFGGPCHQVCANTAGSFVCSCFKGYELEDDSTCSDIDECSLDQTECQHKCINIPGSYRCSCHDGYALYEDNSTCIDVDECDSNTKCSHFCSNEAGSYVCKCPPGLTLDIDGHTCVDVNECEKDNGGCSSICINTIANYHCECPTGMGLINEGSVFERKHICVDNDECGLSNGNCSHICENIEGSYLCKCPEGMGFSNTDEHSKTHLCQDIDECASNNGGCSHRCINKEGGFTCKCPKGLQLNKDDLSCDDVNECDANNGGCSHTCINLPATYECTCPSGWNFDYYEDYVESDATYPEGLEATWKKCIDVDECGIRNGGCSHECINEEGGFYCKCPKGYTLINDYTCEDIDECQFENGGCSHLCVNNVGSYGCDCPEGFSLHSNNMCVDIDECLGKNNCSHHCTNDLGSYVCSCPDGYILEPDKISCTDLNECGKLNGGCSHTCHNSFGEYHCSCPPGWELGPDDHTCFDIDECEQDKGGCSHLCSNSEGSFTCSCPDGSALGIDQKTCLDIDECGSNNGGCSHQCTNKKGHYVCLCPNGYALGIDQHTCEDVNECDNENGGCSHGCKNSNPGHRCVCPPGYMLKKDNRTCEDVNECLTDKGGCSHQCYNIRGSFRCECPSGFELSTNGFTCKDINECEFGNAACSHFCENIPGSFLCTCPPGYSLDTDKTRCIDLDECQLNPCEHDCFNTPGSFYCSCRKGFTARQDSAHLCRDVNECEEKNAGCSHDCFNTIGSYFCKCNQGYKLSPDGHSCETKPVFCPLLVSPTGGEMRCSHDLRGNAYPSGTVCSFTCPYGTALYGESKRVCTSQGIWTNEPVTCQTVKCPALSEIDHGRITPSSCTRSISTLGHRCYLTCLSGYKVIGNPVRTCSASGSWEPDSSRPYCEKDTLKPFIQCPNDVTVDLAPHQEIAYVRLPPPKSNVDWYRSLESERSVAEVSSSSPGNTQRFVESSPQWAKQLESDLPAGRTTVTFMARSPLSDGQTTCSFVVFVRDKEEPQVFGCPKSFHMYLNSADSSEKVTWKEPIFKDNVEVIHIYKSMEPGRKLTVGTYPVHYIAVDAQGNRAKCSFVITVEAAPPVQRVFQPSQVWVVCPGTNNGNPVQMNVWRVPPACTVVSSSITASHVHWDISHTPSEASNAKGVDEVSQPQRKEPSQDVSAYDTQIATSAFSSNSNPSRGDVTNILSSSTAFSSSPNQKGSTKPSESVKTRHQHGFEAIYGDSFPFSNLFQGYDTMAVAHARARGGGGKHETTAFAHTKGNENTQAIAHARARVYS